MALQPFADTDYRCTDHRRSGTSNRHAYRQTVAHGCATQGHASANCTEACNSNRRQDPRPCQKNDSPAFELDGLHARIFPVVCCTQSVEPISSTETCWKEELRHRKSEANRNRNAKPRLK